MFGIIKRNRMTISEDQRENNRKMVGKYGKEFDEYRANRPLEFAGLSKEQIVTKRDAYINGRLHQVLQL